MENRPWRVELVNLQEVLRPIDVLRKTTGVYVQDFYNWSLRRGWTDATTRALPAAHGLIRLLHRPMVRELAAFWREHSPDLVVSVIPHFNRALFESLPAETPLVTVLTDLADHPPHFWIERQDQHYVCGSDRAVDQAIGMGIPREQVWRVSGMAIHPRFYTPIDMDRGAERERLGLAAGVPTGLVLFGGYGSAVMLDIVERLDAAKMPVQLILLCGRNLQLAESLMKLKAPLRRAVKTFTPEIAHYMHMSDFFIGKPGPGSLSEALAMKLPVIVEGNARTMVQERYNCDWIEQSGVGMVLASFKEIAKAVEGMLNPIVYSGFHERVGLLENRAVFEITSILDQVMAQRRLKSQNTRERTTLINRQVTSGK